MKTYEEMARDVLRRRDEEKEEIRQISQSSPPTEVVYSASGKRGLLPKIAIPCAAAVALAAVGFGAWSTLPKRGQYVEGAATQVESAENTLLAQDTASEPDDASENLYKGGKTKIYFNSADEMNVYSLPALLEEDFIGIRDDEINQYYGIEFDRISTVLNWESEHKAFGWYEHAGVTSGTAQHVQHAITIVCTQNAIVYTTQDGGTVTVSASFEKYGSATVENAVPSLINGFDAMVYRFPNGDYAADIVMGGVNVTISTSDVLDSLFKKILVIYTAPDDFRGNEKIEDCFNILPEMPEFLVQNNPIVFQVCTSETLYPVDFKRFTAEEANEYYGIEFDCLGKLHEDWNERVDDLFGIYYIDHSSVLNADGAPEGGKQIFQDINRLYYTTPNGSGICVHANLCMMPMPDEHLYDESWVNGFYTVIYQYDSFGFNQEVYPDGTPKFGAMIDFGGTVVEISSAGLSEEEFKDVLREFTASQNKP